MAADGVVIAVGVIISLLIVFGIVVFMVYMQHPEDKMVAWFPKLVVFLGLFLTCVTVLLVPFDVAIQNGVADRVFSDMTVLWFALFYIVAAWAIVVCPFTIFWYERDEDDSFARQLCTTICFTSIGLFVFIVLTVALYYTIGFVELPLMLESLALLPGAVNQPPPLPATSVGFFANSQCGAAGACAAGAISGCFTVETVLPIFDKTNPSAAPSSGRIVRACYFDHPQLTWENLDRAGLTSSSSSSSANNAWIVTGCARSCMGAGCTGLQASENLNPPAGVTPQRYCSVSSTLTMRTSLPVYILAMLSFFGWFLMILFAGFGLFLVPMDLINDFRNRPIRIDVAEFAKKKNELKQKTSAALQVGREKQAGFATHSNKRKEREFANKFKAIVYELEIEHERLEICHKEAGGNPIIPWAKLFFGVWSMVIAWSWIIQIILTLMLNGCNGLCPFMNSIIIELNTAFPLFAVVTYAIFSFYLLLCVVKGCIKIGMRMFFLISIHPLKVGGTMMNSMLFNTCLLLLTAAPVVQLSASAIPEYTRNSAVLAIYGNQNNYLQGIGKLYSQLIFYIIFVVASFLALLWGAVIPCFRKNRPSNLDEMMASVKVPGRK